MAVQDLQNLIRRIPTSRAELGAYDAFFLDRREEFYVVERGYVDLFLSVADDRRSALSRMPFITRVPAGNAFFGSRTMPLVDDGARRLFAFQAVPSRETVLLRGEREHLASPDTFDLDDVSLIDDWVVAASRFLAGYEALPRDVLLLDADPDVPYRAHSALSAHHLEVLWVSADRPGLFVGRPEFPVAQETLLPLAEHTWLTLPEEARVSALHTPGAILTGRLWTALDRHNDQLLRCAQHYWVAGRNESLSRQSRDRHHAVRLRGAMLRKLASPLHDAPAGSAAGVDGHRSPLHEAAAVVAAAAGVPLIDSPDAGDAGDPLETVDAVVAPSGIRTRRIRLSPGWERRDGPSFLGVVAEDETRPVAVVNDGRGAYRMIDSVSGEEAPVDRRRAASLGARGVMFYAPLARDVDSGLAAVFQALRGRGRDILGVAVMGSLTALIALLTPIVTGQLLGEIIPRVDVPMWTAALAALLLGALSSAAVSVVGALSLLRIEARIDETLQAAVWSKLLSLPLPFFRRYLAGDLADRANGVSLIRQMLTGATGASMVNGVFSIFSYALLFYYSWELALWTGVVLVVLVAASWLFTTRQIRHQRAVATAQGAIDGLVFQMIVGLSKLRQAGAELHVLMRWSERYARQKREHLSARTWAAGQHTFNALFAALSQLAMLALIWYTLLEGGSAMIEGDAPGGPFALADFLSFHAAFGQFMGGMVGLTATWTTVVAVLPLFERVMPIIEAQPESVPGGTVLSGLSGRIEFEHVTFRYPAAERDTLADVSFHIQPGEYVAFVGTSGAGKSTLYRLLLGFERPTAGSVLLDGHDLRSLDLGAMRRQMGVVLQNGQLAPDSIFRNIAGEASLTDDEAWEAANAAGIAADIEALPMGMNTLLAEAGGSLSGGQKQRLLIARALARKPRVLLLDEATSMLDNRNQDTIRATLRGLTATRVLIAHRLRTVVDVDRIYVLQDGRIVETGRYRELLERGGVLAEMARRQFV